MKNFLLLQSSVRAVHIGRDGIVVTEDDKTCIGNANTWVVIDMQGAKSSWSDADFRKHFAPADEDAKMYLILREGR